MDPPLFPCMLPYPDVLPQKGVAGRLDLSGTDPKRRLNDLFAWCNFVVLGLPKQAGSCKPQTGWSSSARARHFADDLLGKAAAFGSYKARGMLPVTGKRAAILASLNSLERRYDSRATDTIDNEISITKSLITDQVAMPAEASTADPLLLLHPERARVLADLVKLREPEELWP